MGKDAVSTRGHTTNSQANKTSAKIKIETSRLLNVEANVLVMRIAYFEKSNVFFEHSSPRSIAIHHQFHVPFDSTAAPFSIRPPHPEVRYNFDVATG